MACILHIETSTMTCSVAVSDDSQVIYHDEAEGASEHLGAMVDAALSFTDSHAIPFDAVAVSGGPGSYTGLRIGVSMAKGVCFGRDLKLISVPTLELLCVPVLLGERVPEDALLCPMLDARRMEVYAAVYDRALRPVRGVQADVVTADTYREWLDRGPVCFFGPGAEKCMTVINHPNARLLDGVVPLARWMQPLAERRLLQASTPPASGHLPSDRGGVEDVAYYEPFYLKDFVAKVPRNPLAAT